MHTYSILHAEITQKILHATKHEYEHTYLFKCNCYVRCPCSLVKYNKISYFPCIHHKEH